MLYKSRPQDMAIGTSLAVDSSSCCKEKLLELGKLGALQELYRSVKQLSRESQRDSIEECSF